MKMSDLTEFLTSSVLVTGGLLVSTQPCSVEGMSIETNASIRDPDAGMRVCNSTFAYCIHGHRLYNRIHGVSSYSGCGCQHHFRVC